MFRPEGPWPPPDGDPPPEQAGVLVASTRRPGSATRSPAWAGTTTRTAPDPGLRRSRRPLGRRHVHAEPGAVAGLPDIASDADAIWNDTGRLYGFRVDDPSVNDYYDVPIGSTASYPGTFVPIAPAAAKGTQTALETCVRRSRSVPVCPRRGHRLRQAFGQRERRLRRRLGSGLGRRGRQRVRIPERPDLEARVHGSRRSDEGDGCCSSRVTIQPVKTPGEIHQPPTISRRLPPGV